MGIKRYDRRARLLPVGFHKFGGLKASKRKGIKTEPSLVAEMIGSSKPIKSVF